MLKATYQQYILNFKQPSGTSRGILKTKETWIIKIYTEEKFGIGECGLFRGLSADDTPNYEQKLQWVCQNINLGLEKLLEALVEFPSIQFGLEQAFLSLESANPFELFPSKFSQGKAGININGLIWMGDKSFMKNQIKQKLQDGFSCIKMKIGAIDFNTEIELLESIRKEFSSKEIELRVDANGAFHPSKALEKLKRLSELDLHSIEQPIQQGQWQEMAKLCEVTPLPIALDEELIGAFNDNDKQKLIETIKPQYIILKPSLVGGFENSLKFINFANSNDIGYWVTSALESNIGLSAIAQWTFSLKSSLPQGLGTGNLFSNNFVSPLEVAKGNLILTDLKKWNLDELFASCK